jgi:hypothetical protein
MPNPFEDDPPETILGLYSENPASYQQIMDEMHAKYSKLKQQAALKTLSAFGNADSHAQATPKAEVNPAWAAAQPSIDYDFWAKDFEKYQKKMIFQSSQDPHGYVTYNFDESPLIMNKKKKSEDLSEEKPWHKRLDKYPKDQTEKTPEADRVCVVGGFKGKGEQMAWRPPYWVHADYLFMFQEIFCQVQRLGIYLHKDDCSVSLAGGIKKWETLEWLKADGQVKLDERSFNGLYQKKSDTFVFYYSEDYPKEHIGCKYHQDSFFTCEVYDKMFNTSEAVAFKDAAGKGHMVSTKAYNDKKPCLRCQRCENFFSIDALVDHPNPKVPQKVCKPCHQKIKEKEVIREWNDSNFLPPIHDIRSGMLKGAPIKIKERRLYGVEVELGFNSGDRVLNAIDVWDTLGHDFAYIKHDGSITKTQFEDGYHVKNPMKMGFEIVTAPAGINVHRERWKALEKAKAFKTFRAWDADSCGFHVHVSRDSLTAFQIGRILVFMNHDNNRYFVDVVAGRGAGFYTRYHHKKFSDCEKVDESKYMAVRTNKEHTIEVRIFRGTVNYRHMIRNIEFVDALCDFCAPCERSLGDMMDFRNFISFVESRGWNYPLLSEWLGTIDLIAKKKLASKIKGTPVFSLSEEAVDDRVKLQMAGILGVAKSAKSISDALADNGMKAPKQEEFLGKDPFTAPAIAAKPAPGLKYMAMTSPEPLDPEIFYYKTTFTNKAIKQKPPVVTLHTQDAEPDAEAPQDTSADF